MTDDDMQLGSVISSDASDVPDIQRRVSLAREMVPNLRRLFRNDELTWEERVRHPSLYAGGAFQKRMRVVDPGQPPVKCPFQHFRGPPACLPDDHCVTLRDCYCA